jgi:UPF0755 protein
LLIGVPVLAFAVFVLRPIQAPLSGTLITIVPGQPLTKIAQQLDDQQVVSDAMAFRLLALISGDARIIQAGSYRFSGSNSPLDVLRRMVAGKVELTPFTVPEGLTAQQVIERCVAAGLGTLEEYQRLLVDAAFCQQLQVDSGSLEGYLFPETYRFAQDTTAAKVLRTMVLQARQQLNSGVVQQAKLQGLNEVQLLTLASIIQKEAGNDEEMPLISAVFHNRLKRGMPLQADPTVIYGIKNFNGNLTRKDLATPSAYNTYVNRGLPPGPIANPGLAALQAAANPAPSSALYFVADGSGGHYFSTNLSEHNRAVRKYLQYQRQNRSTN